MATPPFVTELRRLIGNDPLPLVGVSAVILHGDRVLLGRRADNGAWAMISGVVDPGEEPADAATREALEEAGVVVRATRLARVHQLPRIIYANGDQVDYLDLTFRCEWVSGEPRPVDGELTEVSWFSVTDLDVLSAEHRERVRAALAAHGEAQFRTHA